MEMRREHRQLMLHLEGNCIIHEPEEDAEERDWAGDASAAGSGTTL